MEKTHAGQAETKQEGTETAESEALKKVQQHRGVSILLEEPDELVREQLGGFIQFLRDHAVVGVAIGFIVGLQSQTLIKQLVTSFISPFITLLVGGDLQHRQWVVQGNPPITFPWGEFVYALVDFLVVLLFIYLVVKVFKLDRLDKKQ